MPAPLIEFPDSEGLVINWLPGALIASGLASAAGIKVSNKKPDIGAESIVVYRVGGVPRDFLTDRPTMGFDIRAATATRAIAITNRLIGLVYQLEGTALAGHAINDVGMVRGATWDPFPPADPTRYSCLLTITVRA